MCGNPTPRCEFDAQDLIFRLETTIPADIGKISPVVEHEARSVKKHYGVRRGYLGQLSPPKVC